MGNNIIDVDEKDIEVLEPKPEVDCSGNQEQPSSDPEQARANAESVIRRKYVPDNGLDYKAILSKKWWSRFCKRGFDVFASFFGLLFLLPIFLAVSICIVIESRGGVFFKQQRVGKDGEKFMILKFRTMVKDAESQGKQITVGSDMRITKVGKFLRATKIDELPQLFNVLGAQMSLVGPRPEVPKYVALYNDFERNVLLVRPGITEMSSIIYKDEAKVLEQAEDSEDAYVNEVMPIKLTLNLQYITKLGLFYDIGLIFKTFYAIIKR